MPHAETIMTAADTLNINQEIMTLFVHLCATSCCQEYQKVHK